MNYAGVSSPTFEKSLEGRRKQPHLASAEIDSEAPADLNGVWWLVLFRC